MTLHPSPQTEQESWRPALREGLQFRPVSCGRVFVSHPEAASQILDARVCDALREARGQPIEESLPRVREILEYDCTADEWRGFLEQLADFGYFEGRPKRNSRVRLFDPGPAIEFLTQRCRWVFTLPAGLFLAGLLLAGLWRLASNWAFFVAEVTRVTGNYPLLALVLYYLCFVPIGLLHELAHGLVCRWFGGEVLEVGVKKDSANLYVLSNTAPLREPRQFILYFAGGAFLDMLAFFALVNLWLAVPNALTLMLLLPQAIFVLFYSYSMENGSDLSKIISQWLGIPEAKGRRDFLKSLWKKRPQTAAERKRAVIYLSSIAAQAAAAAFLIWAFRAPAAIHLPGGIQFRVPFWPPLLYLLYRLLRRFAFDLPARFRALRAKAA